MEFTKKHIVIIAPAVAAFVIVCIISAVIIIKLTSTVAVYSVKSIRAAHSDSVADYFEGKLLKNNIEEVILGDRAVDEVIVKEGDEVKEGDILLKYDVSEYRLAIESAQANVSLLESKIAVTRRDIQKFENMKSIEDMDNIEGYTGAELKKITADLRMELDSLQQKLNKAEKGLEGIRQLSDTGELTSRTAGVVSRVRNIKSSEPGDVIIVIEKENSSIDVVFYVNEFKLADIGIDEPVFVVFDGDEPVYNARITEIGESPSQDYPEKLDGSLSYYPVTCSIVDYDDALKSESGRYTRDDLHCKVRTPDYEEAENAVYIQSAYIRSDEKGYYVYAMKKDETLEKRYITAELADDPYAMRVVEGITLSDYLAFPYRKDIYEGVRAQVSKDADK